MRPEFNGVRMHSSAVSLFEAALSRSLPTDSSAMQFRIRVNEKVAAGCSANRQMLVVSTSFRRCKQDGNTNTALHASFVPLAS